MRAVRIEQWGGPEVLQVVADQPEPGAQDGEVVIDVSLAGVNFADTHTRENSYIARYGLPLVPGAEVAGTLASGERVVAMCQTGGYAERVAVPRERVFPIPDGVSDHAALALLIQGLTAWHLYRTCGRVAAGESVVVHSAAGGVGSLATQLGAPMGAGRVIATASSEAKRATALSLGADVAIDGAAGGLKDRLIEANGGRPVDVVFDMAGGAVFAESIEALAPFGRIVAYGIATKEQNDLRTGRLMRKSWSVVGFWLNHCLGRRAMVEEPLAELFAMVARGELAAGAGPVYGLCDVRRMHEDLVARRTTGKVALDPRG